MDKSTASAQANNPWLRHWPLALVILFGACMIVIAYFSLWKDPSPSTNLVSAPQVKEYTEADLNNSESESAYVPEGNKSLEELDIGLPVEVNQDSPWETYTDTQQGWAIDYPADWTVYAPTEWAQEVKSDDMTVISSVPWEGFSAPYESQYKSDPTEPVWMDYLYEHPEIFFVTVRRYFLDDWYSPVATEFSLDKVEEITSTEDFYDTFHEGTQFRIDEAFQMGEKEGRQLQLGLVERAANHETLDVYGLYDNCRLYEIEIINAGQANNQFDSTIRTIASSLRSVVPEEYAPLEYNELLRSGFTEEPTSLSPEAERFFINQCHFQQFDDVDQTQLKWGNTASVIIGRRHELMTRFREALFLPDERLGYPGRVTLPEVTGMSKKECGTAVFYLEEQYADLDPCGGGDTLLPITVYQAGEWLMTATEGDQYEPNFGSGIEATSKTILGKAAKEYSYKFDNPYDEDINMIAMSIQVTDDKFVNVIADQSFLVEYRELISELQLK